MSTAATYQFGPFRVYVSHSGQPAHAVMYLRRMMEYLGRPENPDDGEVAAAFIAAWHGHAGLRLTTSTPEELGVAYNYLVTTHKRRGIQVGVQSVRNGGKTAWYSVKALKAKYATAKGVGKRPVI